MSDTVGACVGCGRALPIAQRPCPACGALQPERGAATGRADAPAPEPPVRPASLASLVSAAGSSRDHVLPRPAPSASNRGVKLAYLDEDASGSSLGLVVLPLLLVGVIAGPTLLCSGHAWLGALVLSAVAIVLATAHARGKRVDGEREARLAGALGEQPFPVVGFLDWLLADRPLADVTVEAPIDAELFASAVRVVDARATVEWLGPCRARIALSPRLLRRAKHRAPELRSGDLVLLRALIDRVLVPLHAEVRIARLELGGEANAASPGER